MRPTNWRLLLLGVIMAMIAASCGSDDTSSTTAAPAETEATQAGAGGDDTQATEATEAAAGEDFGEPVTLNLGHPFPAEHPIHQRALLPWSEAVAAATDGTVTIEFHPGGALGPPPATYDNVVVGAQDIGWALQGYTAGRFPITDIIEMPFQFDSATTATEVLWALWDEFPEFQQEYSDVKVLGLWVHDLGDLWTRDKRVETMEDINGLTLRSPSPVQNAVIERLGGNPVGMPAPEIFDSLERGVIDGLMIAQSGLRSFNLFPVLQYGVACNCYVAAMWLTMNLDKWNSLSPAQQAAIDELSGRAFSMGAAEVYDAAYVATEAAIQEAGIEKVVLSDEEMSRWIEATQPVIDDWIAAREAEGVPAQAMWGRLQELKNG